MSEALSVSILGFGPDGWTSILMGGAATTIAAAFFGLLLALSLGAIGASAKVIGPHTARTVANAYTTALRGVPELLVIFLLYFGSSSVLGSIAGLFGYEGFIALPGFVAGVLALGIVEGAQMVEVLRGAFMAVKPGEIEAAKACGMNRLLRFRRIIAPLTMRHALPGIGNVWVGLLKGSTLLSATGVSELMRQTQVAADSTRLPFDFYLYAAAIYIAITVMSGLLFQGAERYFSRGVVAG